MKAYIASTEPLTEKVITILKAAKEVAGISENIQFALLDDGMMPHPSTPVLALGKYERRGTERVVTTYSVPQIMVKSDSISVLVVALRNIVGQPVLPEFKWELITSQDELWGLSDRLQSDSLVVDIETRGDVDAQVPQWDDIISLAFYDGHTAYVITEELIRANSCHGPIHDVWDFGRLLTAANGKFDFKYLSEGSHTPIYPDNDTMLMHYALYPAASTHGLKELAKMYLGVDDWDAPIKPYTRGKTYKEWTDLGDGAYAQPMKYRAGSGYERIPRSMLYLYNAYDVYYTWHLLEIFEDELRQDDNALKVYGHLMELSNLYQRVESAGVRFDVPYMRKMQKELNLEGEQLEQELHELVGYSLNPRSPQQVKAYFNGAGYNLKSTDKDTMQELAAEGNEVAKKILRIRDNSKKNGTYITGYLDKLIGDRGYPGFKLHAASTGRLGGAGPSLLTIPRDKSIKRMVLPDEGHIIASADLSQAELRAMAVESGDEWMLAAFQPGAGDFFDLLMENTYEGLDAAQYKAEHLQEYTDLRAKFKGVVYGVSFGRSTRAIALALEISQDEAQKLVDGFVRPGSAFAAWRTDIANRAVNGEPIVNRLGRQFQAELVTSRNRQNVINSALSFMSQSTANDICLIAMKSVEAWLPEEARIMASIHDAIYVTTPPDKAQEVGELIAREMRAAGDAVYGDAVEFVAEAEYGPNLADLKPWDESSYSWFV